MSDNEFYLENFDFSLTDISENINDSSFNYNMYQTFNSYSSDRSSNNDINITTVTNPTLINMFDNIIKENESKNNENEDDDITNEEEISQLEKKNSMLKQELKQLNNLKLDFINFNDIEVINNKKNKSKTNIDDKILYLSKKLNIIKSNNQKLFKKNKQLNDRKIELVGINSEIQKQHDTLNMDNILNINKLHELKYNYNIEIKNLKKDLKKQNKINIMFRNARENEEKIKRKFNLTDMEIRETFYN